LCALSQATNQGIRAIVLSPTRELAVQTARVAAKLVSESSLSVTLLSKTHLNDASFKGQSANRCDLIVSTPLTLLHLLESNNPDINVSHLQHIVLDEADRLLDLGFLPQVDAILALLQKRKKLAEEATQSVVKASKKAKVIPKKSEGARSYRLHLFSATLPMGLDTLVSTLLMDAVRVVISHRNTAQSHVKQELKFVGNEDGKLMAMRSMIREGLDVPMLIFVQSSERARQLMSALSDEGVRGLGLIHGEMNENQRSLTIDAFRTGDKCVLVATDVLARGLDLKPARCVLNYDLPQSTIDYIHRIGRTGRAGRSGHAITFFTHADKPLLRYIAGVMAHSGAEIPQWILDTKKGPESVVKRLAHVAPPREPIVRGLKDESIRKNKRKRLANNDKPQANQATSKSEKSSAVVSSKSGEKKTTSKKTSKLAAWKSARHVDLHES